MNGRPPGSKRLSHKHRLNTGPALSTNTNFLAAAQLKIRIWLSNFLSHFTFHIINNQAQTLSILTFIFRYTYFYMYECFSRLHVCVPHICLVSMEVKSKPWMPWSWSYKRLWAVTTQGTEPGSSEERQMLLAWGPLSYVYLSSVSSHTAARGFPWYSEADPVIFLLGSPHGFTKTKLNAEGTQSHLEICLDTLQTNSTCSYTEILHTNTLP